MSQASSLSSPSNQSQPGWAVNSDKNVGDVDENENNNEDNAAPTDNSHVDVDLGTKAGQCQALYEANENSKALLLLMCVGIKAECSDRILGDVDIEPYKSFKPRNKVACSNKDTAEEVVRRATIQDIREKGKPPKPKNWSTKKLTEWLKKNPRVDPQDVEFLRATEFALWTAFTAAKHEEDERKEASKRSASWLSIEPCLRLYECACHDDARQALLVKDLCMDRQQLDARNSEHRPKTFDEVVADLFNDPEFVPSSDALPELHSSFTESIDLPFSAMPGQTPITPEQVKSKLADARCKLMKIINRWERSGNGFGQLRDDEEEEEEAQEGEEKDQNVEEEDDEDDDEARPIDLEADVPRNFGHLVVENYMAGDNRQSFVFYHEGESEHHLYLWHKLDSQGILSKVINKLHRSVAIDCDAELPDVSEPGSRAGSKRKKNQDIDEDFKSTIGGALTGLTYQAMVENRDRARRTVNEYRVNRMRETCQSLKVEWSNVETEAKKDLTQIEEQMFDYEKQFNLKQVS